MSRLICTTAGRPGVPTPGIPRPANREDADQMVRRLEFVRSIDVPRSVEVVFGYASDFNRAVEWRVEVAESSMEPAGPMQLGSRLHEVAVLARHAVLTESVVDAYEPPNRFTFAHVSGPMAVSGELLVEPIDEGARLTYTLRVGLTGFWALLTPVFRRTGPRMMQRSLRRLAARLTAPDA
jgi:hypothetical protein